MIDPYYFFRGERGLRNEGRVGQGGGGICRKRDIL